MLIDVIPAQRQGISAGMALAEAEVPAESGVPAGEAAQERGAPAQGAASAEA